MNQISYQNKDVNPVATLGDFIWIKDGSLSKKQCKNIVKKFEESEESHYVGKIGKDEINQQVKQKKSARRADLSMSRSQSTGCWITPFLPSGFVVVKYQLGPFFHLA